jgi:hypothetical protein
MVAMHSAWDYGWYKCEYRLASLHATCVKESRTARLELFHRIESWNAKSFLKRRLEGLRSRAYYSCKLWGQASWPTRNTHVKDKRKDLSNTTVFKRHIIACKRQRFSSHQCRVATYGIPPITFQLLALITVEQLAIIRAPIWDVDDFFVLYDKEHTDKSRNFSNPVTVGNSVRGWTQILNTLC